SKSVYDVCFSPDGTRLASGSRDHTVRIWDAHTGNPIGDALVGHTLQVYHLYFSPDSTRLVSISPEQDITWDISSVPIVKATQQLDSLPPPTSSINVNVRSSVDREGWLHVDDNRTIWIPEQCRGDQTAAFRREGGAGTTVCIGGETGTVSIFW